MARTVAGLPAGTRITDFISLGVVANRFPLRDVQEALEQSGKASKRQRDLPAHVMVYYVIAMALYMQSSCREVLRCLLEGVRWLIGPEAHIKVTGRGGIANARARIGSEPLQLLHDKLVVPIAVQAKGRRTQGAWYRRWRVVSMDGSTMDVADTRENEEAFGKPMASRGQSAYPQIRFVSLVENGTRVLFGTQMGGYRTSEGALCDGLLPYLKPGMLALADRNFFSHTRWRQAHETGADLLWRVKKNQILPCRKRLEDGSYLSKVYPSDKDRRHDTQGVVVRVIEYALPDTPNAEPLYRLITTLLEPEEGPAEELAALYHDRWEIENAFDEFKTHLRGGQIVLRSKTPDLVKQEFFGFLMAHFAVRGLLHEAALKADEDPDQLSFLHAVRVIRRKMAHAVALPPSGSGVLPCGGS